MALLYMDSFCGYGLAGEALLTDGNYAQVTTGFTIVADPDGVSDGTVLKMNSASTGYLRKVLPSSAVTALCAGARVWFPSLPAAANQAPYIHNIRNGANQSIGYLKPTTTGAIELYMCQDGGTLGTPTLVGTTNSILTAEQWWHLEVKYDLSTSIVTIRVEGVELELDTADFTLHTGVSTIAQISQVRNTSLGFGTVLHMKDYYISDTSGSTVTGLVGPARIINLVPTSDDALGWTPSTGAVGWSILDDQPTTDTNYISGLDDVIPTSSSFVMEDLPVGIDAVKAVMTKVRVGKSDGGEGNLRTDFTVDATYATGTDSAAGVGFGYRHDVFTSAGYTPTTLNSAKVKITRTA